jgi:hypothetical protein
VQLVEEREIWQERILNEQQVLDMTLEEKRNEFGIMEIALQKQRKEAKDREEEIQVIRQKTELWK